MSDRDAAPEPPFRLDANLLVALDALLRERSVTRAARRLGMGQPGLSHVLARLRTHFGDPLLARHGRQMVLTPRAQRLVIPVADAVAALKRVFAEEGAFDPTTSRRTFRVAITDGVGYVLLPALLASLDRTAPRVTMQFLPIPQRPVVEDLIAGRVDLAVTHFGELPASVRRERLYVERYVALVARENRVFGARMDTTAYRAASHVAVETRLGATSKLDALLRERGIERAVRVVVPHFLLVPHAVAGTRRVVTLGERLARGFAACHPLRVVELDLGLPGYDISQVWHERHHDDVGIAWLRREVLAAMQAGPPGRRRHSRHA
jgi:DNA-binding transcriptional LysR family regulator